MEKITINPEDIKEEYIKNLNACFNGWGGEKEYEWGFNRKVGEHTSDIMLIENDEDGVIAGSAVSYRRLSGKTASFDIGIMTGSWTLPAARRKGCFTKMINCSKDMCSKNNVPYLTAFVTEDNASRRRLESEGSYMYPTYHLFSPEKPFKDEEGINVIVPEHGEEIYGAIFERMNETQENFLNFNYSFEEFRGQYLNRIKETTFLKMEDDFAILENGVNEVKVLLLTYPDRTGFKRYLKALTNWCLENRSKKSFYFTTRKELSEAAQELNFESSPGYFTILGSMQDDVPSKHNFENLNINMADKM